MLLALKVISIRSMNNFIDVAECKNSIRFQLCIVQVSDWLNMSKPHRCNKAFL